MKWRLFSSREKWPEWVETQQGKPSLKRVTGFKVHYLPVNHACVLIQFGGKNILTDPIYSQRTSPVSWAGPKRVRKPGISFEDLPPIDMVVISHNHYDHLDLPTLKKLKEKFDPVFYIGLKNGELLKSEGITKIVEMNWWQTEKNDLMDITFVPAQHWSARGLFDRFETLWGGFYLKSKNAKVYFAGDTGYGNFFTLIKEKLGSPDLSFLPIGAYEPRWFMKNAHMNPTEAVKAHHDLESGHSIGIHFETFQLTNEAFETPRKEFQEAWLKSQKKGSFEAPEFGKEYVLEVRR
ncbi:MAG: MBL fold metallo-hydrolase [Halobacteriovoraceae bacterium]|nr:MBL fold metallo-hydrolase [Halobacteriovoraceae bacterium]